MNPGASSPDSAPRYRFTARSPEEVAGQIRSKLGPTARVLQVQSFQPTGLRRLWQSARLEVVAMADPAAPEETSPPPAPGPVPPATRSTVIPPRRGVAAPAAPTLASVLLRCGFSDTALGRLQTAPFWPELAASPLNRALPAVGRHLRQMARRGSTPLRRAAFLGTAGVGRTTALCKWLGLEQAQGRAVQAVAAALDRPGSGGPLPAFCQALELPLAHYPGSTRSEMAGAAVYADLPGLSVRSPAANAALADFLEREEFTERILVLNAAYDNAALRAAHAVGRDLGATHLALTHLDEVQNWGRLWEHLFDSDLEPILLSTGPSLTAETETDVFGAFVRRTLADEPEERTPVQSYSSVVRDLARNNPAVADALATAP